MAKKKTRKSSFRGRTGAAAKKESSSTGSNYIKVPAGISFYSPEPDSKQRFDVIPYEITDKNHLDIDPEIGLEVGELWYKKPYKVHRNVGADKQTVVCPTTFGKKCPICEYKNKRSQAGADWEELKIFNPSKRNLYWVIPRGVKKLEEIIHLFDFSHHNFQKLLNKELNEEEEYEEFPAFEGGYTLKVRWDEATIGKKGKPFAEASRIDFEEREEDIDEDILSEVPSLDDLLICLTYEQIKAKFFQDEDLEKDDLEESEEEDDDLPFKEDKPKKTSKSKKQKKEEPEEPEEDNEDEDEGDDSNLTWEDLKDMEGLELTEVIEEYDLDIDLDDFEDDEDGLRSAVADELEIEIPKKKPSKTKDTKKKGKTTEKPKKQGKQTEKAKKCPVKGGVFGDDWNEYEECDTCRLLDDCEDA